MPARLSPNPTPAAFAKAWAKEVLSPALSQRAGADGRLSQAEARGGAALSGPARLAEDNLADVFAATGAKRSTAVATALKAGERLARAAAAGVAGSDGRLSAAELDTLSKLRADFGFLLGNGAPERELGVVSDLDSTVIPPEKRGVAPPPYPGIAALLSELEGQLAGDVRYVTARTPARVATVPDYLETHGLPEGPIDTGTSQVPWVAQPEKVRDITRIFEANPGQRFVLFGDTKARDPEVYREIAARFPTQVAAIVIHKVDRTVPPARVEGMSLVENYAEAAGALRRAGVLDTAAARRVMVAAQAEGLALTAAQLEALLS